MFEVDFAFCLLALDPCFTHAELRRRRSSLHATGRVSLSSDSCTTGGDYVSWTPEQDEIVDAFCGIILLAGYHTAVRNAERHAKAMATRSPVIPEEDSRKLSNLEDENEKTEEGIEEVPEEDSNALEDMKDDEKANESPKDTPNTLHESQVQSSQVPTGRRVCDDGKGDNDDDGNYDDCTVEIVV